MHNKAPSWSNEHESRLIPNVVPSWGAVVMVTRWIQVFTHLRVLYLAQRLRLTRRPSMMSGLLLWYLTSMSASSSVPSWTKAWTTNMFSHKILFWFELSNKGSGGLPHLLRTGISARCQSVQRWSAAPSSCVPLGAGGKRKPLCCRYRDLWHPKQEEEEVFPWAGSLEFSATVAESEWVSLVLQN